MAYLHVLYHTTTSSQIFRHQKKSQMQPVAWTSVMKKVEPKETLSLTFYQKLFVILLNHEI